MEANTHQARHLAALQELPLGLIRSTVAPLCNGQMPDPLPDVHALPRTPGETAHFRVPGLYGGYSVTVHFSDPHTPYILAERWSRVAGGSQIEHRITLRSIEIVSEGKF